MSQSSSTAQTNSGRWLPVVVTFGLLPAYLFLSLDSLVGAVGLRAWYTPFGVAMGMTVLSLIPFAALYGRFSPAGRIAYLLVAFLSVGIVAILLFTTRLWEAAVLLGWFTGILSGAFLVRAPVLLIVTGLAFVLQFVFYRFKPRTTHRLAKRLMAASLIYGAVYYSGVAAWPPYAEAEISAHMVHANRQYFLYLWYGWLGDPDYLALYECNDLGYACQVMYEAPPGHYRGSQLALVVDEQTQQVSVQIDEPDSPGE